MSKVGSEIILPSGGTCTLKAMNLGHQAPPLPDNSTDFKKPLDLFEKITKLCNDYTAMPRDYRRKRCKDIAVSCMKEHLYNLEHLQKDWFSIDIDIAPVSDILAQSTICVGNLYTMATLCGEVIQPWEWTEKDEYVGTHGVYSKRLRKARTETVFQFVPMINHTVYTSQTIIKPAIK